MEKTFYYKSFGISYTDTGQGTPVLLIHGFGEDSRIFDEQANFLRPHCRLIIPDLPASGNSAPIGPDFTQQVSRGLPSSIDLMAEAMAALMNSLGIDHYILLGHSMGGYISLAIAEKHGNNLLALELIHSTAYPDSEEKKAGRRSGIEAITQKGGFAFLQTAIPGLFTESFKKEQPGRVASLIEQFNPAKTGKTTLDSMLIAYYEAMIARPDRTHVLSSSNVPVLFIIGTEDKAVSMDDELKQVHLPSTSVVHIHENTAHMSMMENSDSLSGQLLKFIRDNSTITKQGGENG
jgi:pimeloyl-ACP methyl ester carboxylesterase